MSQNQYQSNPYSQPYSQAPAAEAGYGYGGNAGYGQESHEMQPYGQQQQAPAASAGASVMSQQDFLARVSHVRSEIRTMTSDIQSIGQLHQRSLAEDAGSSSSQLENLVSQTQLRNTSIRDQLRSLERDANRTSDPASHGLKKRQFDALSGEFRRELQGFLSEESQFQQRYRDQISRQYRIVNPDASEEEVRQAAQQDWGNEGIFQTALRTNRTGQASAVLGAVRARHNELQRIEQSITELSGLFQDLDTLVVMQEPAVVRAEEQTEQTNQHLQKGNEQVDQANKHARNRRKLKWWCALVVLLIILAIALGVGLGVALTKK